MVHMTPHPPYPSGAPGGASKPRRRGAPVLEVVGGTVVIVALAWILALGWLARGNAMRYADDLAVRPHIVPVASAASVHVPAIRFTFNGIGYTVTPQISGPVYEGAAESTRSLVRTPDQSDRQWSDLYFACFLDDPAQSPAIEDLIGQLRAIRDKAKLGNDAYLELIAKCVQSVPYDDAQASSGVLRTRFPVETLVEGTGMCGDKSLVLAKLLSHEGYAVALLEFPSERHMVVGVKGPGATYDDSGWLFLETTAPTYVTDVPEGYSGGLKLTSKPLVHVVGSGTRTYGSADDIAKIVRVRDGADPAAKALYQNAKSRVLTPPEAEEINRKLDIAHTASISLRSNVHDEANQPVGVFMDRPQALRWIATNAWW